MSLCMSCDIYTWCLYTVSSFWTCQPTMCFSNALFLPYGRQDADSAEIQVTLCVQTPLVFCIIGGCQQLPNSLPHMYSIILCVGRVWHTLQYTKCMYGTRAFTRCVPYSRVCNPLISQVCTLTLLIYQCNITSVGPADESSHYKYKGRKPYLGIPPGWFPAFPAFPPSTQIILLCCSSFVIWG